MTNPTAAMIVIGDEILSGRTRDANMYYLAGQLTYHGIDLCQVRVVADDADDIIEAINQTRAKYTYVFTSGGIGPTHDDITADCVANAFGIGIDVRDDARQTLISAYPNGAQDLTPARERMARIPDGATLIANTVSFAPGFTVENVHVMAGVPAVFKAMVTALMPQLTKGAVVVSASVRVELPESQIADRLGLIAKQFPSVSIGSYPFYEDDLYGANLVVRGTDPETVAKVGNPDQRYLPFLMGNPLPSSKCLYDAIGNTWPPAQTTNVNGWLIQDGQGGGKRVSAALQHDQTATIQDAENAQRDLGQDALFMIRDCDTALDAELHAQGYKTIDPVVLMVAHISELKKSNSGDMNDSPSAAMKQIWADGGIGPARLDVMARAQGPKTYANIDDKARGL